MTKVRVSQHSGRVGSAAHNDRSFLQGMTERERADKAPHIRPEETRKNRTWSIGSGDTLKDREMTFYRERYGVALEETNRRYKRQGHPERCRTIEQVYTGQKTRPEEMIIQIGDRDAGVDPDTFSRAVVEYLRRLETWNSMHGGHMHVLDVSIHLDESSPHAHVRRVWDYTDKDGHVRLGQNKALQAAGVSLPHPDKPEGRYNNRKISFDTMARGMWQDIVREHGFEVETEPRPSARHKDKIEFVNDRLREAVEETERAEQKRRETEGHIRERLDQADEILDRVQDDVRDAELKLDKIEGVLDDIRETGKLSTRRRYKTLTGEEYIRISPEEAKALDAAVEIKVPLREAVEDAQRRIDAILRQTQLDMWEYQKKAQRAAEESKSRLSELLRPRAQRQPRSRDLDNRNR